LTEVLLSTGDRATKEKLMRQNRRPGVGGRGRNREMEGDGKCDGGMYTEGLCWVRQNIRHIYLLQFYGIRGL
jgi:hypothetical protein